MLKIAMLHKYIAEKELPFFMKDGLTAKQLCKDYNYNVFVSGDNHHGFVYCHENNKQFVINPGCITRQESTFKNYQPRVYLYDTDTKQVETKYLLDTDLTAIQDVNEEQAKEREDRIDSFIEMILKIHPEMEGFGISLDFEKNIEIFCQQNCIKDSVREKIMRSLK